jgi:hypothetical protein
MLMLLRVLLSCCVYHRRRYGVEREESDGGLAAVFGNKDKDKDSSNRDTHGPQQQPSPIDNSKLHSNATLLQCEH